MNRFRLSGTALLAALVTLLALAPEAIAQKGRGGRKGTTAPASAAEARTAGEVPKKVSDAVVLEVGREKFSVGQIADVFRKNANRGGKSFYELDRDSAVAFLDLYSRYRLKVQAALDAGLDRQQEVIADLQNNRMQLAIPPAPQTGYLIERKVVDPAVERIFKLREDEVKVSVVFSAMRANDPADTLRAFRRTVDMLQRLMAGEDFAKMVFDSSDDRTFATSGGAIWITGGMLFPEMEAAAYETKPGEMYQGAIRVPAGFVLLKVVDRRPRVRVRASHIFIDTHGTDSLEGWRVASERIQQAQARLAAGEKFEDVARDMSDDKTSGSHGGDLGSFYTRSLGFEAANGRLWPEFESALFELKDGEVSQPVRTSAGMHIIRRVESRSPVFADEKETIRSMYKQQFLADDRADFVRRTIEKHGFRMSEPTLNRVLAMVNQAGTTADTAWAARIPEELRRETLYSFNGTNFSVGAWIDSIETRRELRVTPLHPRGIRNSINFLLEPAAMTAEASNLEQEYPEFASLMNEFRDGILIFKLEDELIWSKLKYDEEQGKAFWAKRQNSYQTEPKLAVTEIFLYKDDEVGLAQARLAENPNAFDSLAAQMTQRAGYREKGGKWTLSGPKNADLVRQVLDRVKDPRPGTVVGPFAYQSGQSIVRIDQYEAPRAMSYDEARPEVMSDFVDYLQKKLQDEWIDTLKLKYRVRIDDRTLNQALATK
jgi:peptidyl-prolyl cis-trans isomerase SurA